MSQRQFKVIPVIDVRHGTAVRAWRGDRASYRALETPLAPGTSDPVTVANGYRSLYPFDTLYLADLDGIEGRGANYSLQDKVAAAWGAGEVWVDDGSCRTSSVRDAISVSQPASQGGFGGEVTVSGGSSNPSIITRPPDPPGQEGAYAVRDGRRSTPKGQACARRVRVVGSESLLDSAGLQGLVTGVLSLDFRGDDFLGPPALLADPDLWPRRVIVMTLARVGGGDGPDYERLRDVIARAGADRLIYAAGGVRNGDDLEALRVMGAAGVLVATALHDGRIKTGDLLRDRR